MEVVGIKPFWNVCELEKVLHAGLAQFWYSGEWYRFPDESYGFVSEEFKEFHDDDRDMNSVDFIYWINGSGMVEMLMEHEARGVSLRRWQRDTSGERKV